MPVAQSQRKCIYHCSLASRPLAPLSCSGDVSSMNRDNPLYESQEIRMEMFADVSEEEEGMKCAYREALLQLICTYLHCNR